MAQPANPERSTDTPPPDPYADYRPVYAWLLQAWLVMFLAVVCLALIFYLYPHVLSVWRRIVPE
jgi:hypothetical protein